MEYTSVATNPFGVLTAVVAPAILTNACSVLALGTINRIARVVDRTRTVTADLLRLEPQSPHYKIGAVQLPPLQVRARLLIRALRLFYAGLGLFAATALVAIGGSIAAYYGQKPLFEVAAGLAILTGASAVAALASGCLFIVHETRLAVLNLEQEQKILITH